jgi:PAS domain S-box-containing protein
MKVLDGLAHAREPGAGSSWQLFDLVANGIAVTRPDGTLEYCNAALMRMLAQESSTLLGASIFTFLDGGAGKELERLHRSALVTHNEMRGQVRGSRGKFSATAVMQRVDRYDGLHVIWSFVDTRLNESVPELALWGTEIGLWDWDVVNDRLTWINDWCEHSQLTAYSGSGHEHLWSSRVHPEDLPAYKEALSRHLDGHAATYEVEYRLRNRDEAWVWIQERGRVIERDSGGRAVRVVGLCLDVDERHSSARALERSESRFAHAVWGSSVGMWEHDIRTDMLYWWNDWCASVDLDPCAGPRHSERWYARTHSDDQLPFMRTYQSVVDGQSEAYEIEYRVLAGSGQWRWIMSRGRAVSRDDLGRATRMAGVLIDIDARKRMELALRDSEARLEAAIWGADLGLWDWKLDDDSLLWMSDWPMRYGIAAPIRMIRRDEWIDRVHPLDRDKYAAEDHALIHDGRNSAESDYRIRSSSGEWRWVNVRTRVVERSAAGQAMRIVGACIDVDARRRAELMLRTQAMILETMREGVVLVTLDGRIEFTNPALDRMFGRGPGELEGISLFELFNDRQVQSPAAALEGLLSQYERAGKHDILFRRRDGTQFAGEVLSAEIELSGERKILVVVQDVSERRQLEQQIVEIANQERRRLGADLHDGLGQELTGISLMLRSLAKRVAAATLESAPQLDEIITLVNHAIQSARKMALGISPVTLERGGLLPALQTLIGWSRDSYGIDVRLHLSIRSPLLVGEAGAAHLYLIVQEAINNAVRHGRAQSITVALRINRVLMSLSITDDGVGIAENSARGAGMGIKLMEYRAAVIGGTMAIKRLRDGGTRIRCVWPHAAGAMRLQ